MSNRRAIVGFLIVLVFVFGVAFASGLPERLLESPTAAPGESTGVRGLIVEPDDGRAPVLEEIEGAQDSIDLMIYLITDDRIIDSLTVAERRGVDVRILLEHDPFGGAGDPEDVASQLRLSGAEVRWTSNSFTFTHAKTMIVDRTAVAILTLNLSRSSFESNREFGVISTWPDDVREFQEIFDADWEGRAIESNGPLVVSPDDSRDELIEFIDGAKTSIEIYAEVVRDQEVVDRLESAEVRGVAVRMILSPDDDPNSLRIAAELTNAGVEIRYSSDLYIHAKAILVDDKQIFVGSQNLTLTSMDKNREIGIIVVESDILKRFEATFEGDFEADLIES